MTIVVPTWVLAIFLAMSVLHLLAELRVTYWQKRYIETAEQVEAKRRKEDR